MNSGPTSERIYDALKRRVLARGYRPGERLDPARLGDDLHSSVTPVRDALHVLAGEGIVDSRTSDGFHVMAIDAPALEDLYQWNAQILLLAIRSWPLDRPGAGETAAGAGGPAAHPAAQLFERIAAQSANAEHLRAIRSVNDRLEAARLSEALPPDGQDEVAAMTRLLERGDTNGLRRSVTAYHRRRRNAAADIVRALYRPA